MSGCAIVANPTCGASFSRLGLRENQETKGLGGWRRISSGKQGGGTGRSLQVYHRGLDQGGRLNFRNNLRCPAFVEDQDGDEVFASQAVELLSEEESQSFMTRLIQAWNVLFPPKRRSTSNAEIAKQRLKMILISDRCAVNDEAKRRIVDNIVDALSSFVEIESQDKVQLTVSSDPDLGTVYSVIVPVRRVRPEYQDYSRELQKVELCEDFRTLDLKLEYQSDVQEGQQG